MAVVRGATFEVRGQRELERQFARIGKMPKKYLTKAARVGMSDPLKEARTNAPKGKTGHLKRSIRRKTETPNKRNKVIYRLVYNPSMTPNFLKPTTGKYGGKTPNAYYPASVEYGYKGPKGKIFPKTMYWLSTIMERNERSSIQKVVDSLNDSIDEMTR